MLIQAAWKAIKQDESLELKYQELRHKRGAKIAIVAIARKLVGIARSCAKNRKFYEMPVLEALKEAA